MVENTLCIFCGKLLQEENPQTFKSKVCSACWVETLSRGMPDHEFLEVNPREIQGFSPDVLHYPRRE